MLPILKITKKFKCLPSLIQYYILPLRISFRVILAQYAPVQDQPFLSTPFMWLSPLKSSFWANSISSWITPPDPALLQLLEVPTLLLPRPR